MERVHYRDRIPDQSRRPTGVRFDTVDNAPLPTFEFDELTGLGSLLSLAVERVTRPIEGMHRAIVRRSLSWTGSAGAPAREAIDSALAGSYKAIRVAGGVVGGSVRLWARLTAGSGRRISQSRGGSLAQAALNAAWGDELERSDNELQIQMGLRDDEGRPIHVSSIDLAARFPSATSHVVVLVHGLGQTELCWQAALSDGPRGLWDRLFEHETLTPVMIRYNTGAHISKNGAALARLLEQMSEHWPMPIHSIKLVGNSMGGLLLRSACHQGSGFGHSWIEKVDQMITLGSPHLGAPLEKAVALASMGLRLTPESQPLADLLDSRSSGIKDLRFGALVDEDWMGADSAPLSPNPTTDVPLLEGAEHHFVAGVVTSSPTHPIGMLFGDLMVRTASGTGRGRGRQLTATSVQVFGGRRHPDLIHDTEILDRVMALIDPVSGSSCGAPVASTS